MGGGKAVEAMTMVWYRWIVSGSLPKSQHKSTKRKTEEDDDDERYHAVANGQTK